MQYAIRVLLRVSLGFAVLLVLPVGCSTLMVNQKQTLQNHVARHHDSGAARRVGLWLTLRQHLQHQSSLSEIRKVHLANNFFNDLPWRADEDNWTLDDYWATPLETLVNNGGDCEDLAIGKYFTLVDGGIDPDRLRLTYVWLLTTGEAHMVLTYLPPGGGEPLVLDNINPELLTLSERRDLEPVYSFNLTSLWLAENPGEPVDVSSQARLEKWRAVNERMAREIDYSVF